ncbi:hypothetical protein G6L37_00505 [Agrobacterium rubi]|nr:hypothetical protein [Agrobacterium rubi]NTF23870.1 hypothetical protein [Agrobacterium rubi]
MTDENLYAEAIDAGLSRREASYVSASREIGEIAREARERQAEFLSQVGLTLEEARELDEDGRTALNEQWSAFIEGRETCTAATP